MSEGSLGYYSSSSVLTELSAGGSGTVLTMGATLPAWTASSGLNTNTTEDHLTANFDSSSTTAVSTGMEIVITDNSGAGIALCQCSGAVVSGALDVDNVHEIFVDGSLPNNSATGICNNKGVASDRQTVSVNWNLALSGETITWMMKVSSSNCTIIGTNPPTASLQIAEVY